MSDHSQDTTLSPGKFYAQSIMNRINDFIAELEKRGELTILRQITNRDAEFQGGIVGQMPERFTEEQLIRPLLDSLGYDSIVPQPADLVHDQRTVPDFKINMSSDKCTGIVEAKRFGLLDPPSEDPGVSDEVEDYLGENALTKYKRDLDVEYLLGIGTDGIVWLLYGKNLETGEQIVVHTASLQESFKQAILAKQFEDTADNQWGPEQRSELRDTFVPRFRSDLASDAVMNDLSG